MRWAVAVLVAGIVAASSTRGDDESKSDMQKLEGTWKIASIEVAGKKVGAPKGAPDEVVIKDGKANFLSAGKELETFRNLMIELDPKKKPRAMDLLRGPNEGLPCIYEVTATDLKIAMPLVPKKRKPGEGLPRPESFDSKDKPVMVFIAKRDKK